MRLFLLILLATPCFAGGPKYSHKDPLVNDEFVQVYHDIRNVLNGDVYISSASLTTTFIPPAYSSMTIQVQISSVTASSATTVTSYVPSNIAVSITPRYATSRIKLTSYFTAQTSSLAPSDFVTFYRGTTNIGPTNGLAGIGNSGATTSGQWPFSIFYVDSPATASAITYTVYMKVQSGTLTLNNSGTLGLIMAEELR